MKSVLTFLSLVFLLSACSPEKPASLLDVGIPLQMAEYRKDQVADVIYGLTFNIPESMEDSIPSVLTLSLNINDLSHPLYLDFNERADKIKGVQVNGSAVEINHEKEHLIISSNDLQKGENEILIDFVAGELSLNRNEDFLYTLLVPDRASTLFPCFDQPDIKASYVLNITAPKEWSVLCGAPLRERIERGNFTEHQFEQTARMSTYLFSFVAGKFETASQNPGEFDMTLLYRETDEEKKEASISEIFELHQQSIDFLKDYTGYDFPFQKLDFACIPGFQYGGMEHVGAIQYRESSLFLDNSATESRKLGRGKLIAHETAHMWFGDLVTMKWFNDVWMKEVFANFMADKIANPAFPDINHDLQFVTGHYPAAYSEDRTRGTNPIRQKLDNLKNAGTLYGRIIYNKAPIMMRQLEATMGKEAFQDGIKEYIKTYADGNADWNQLVEILDEKTSKDMKQWSEVWVNQSGRPVLSAELNLDEDDRITSLDVSQRAEDGSDNLWPQTFHISLIYPDSVHTIPVSLSDGKVRVDQATDLPNPITIIYNSNGFGYGVFPVDEEQLSAIADLDNEVARGHSYLNLYENTLTGLIPAKNAFKVFKNALSREENELIIRLLTRQAGTIYQKYLTPSERESYQGELENQLFDQLQSDLPANIKKTLFGLFSSVAYSDSGKDRLYRIWNKDFVIQDLRLNEDDFTDMAMSLAIFEHENASDILERAQNAISNPDKLDRFEFILPTLSSDESVRDAFFESLRDPANREKEAWVLSAVSNIHHPIRQETAVKHLSMCLEILEEIQQTGDIFFPKRWLTSTIGRYSSPEAYEVLENFLNSNPDFHPVLKNKLLQATDDLYRVQNLN